MLETRNRQRNEVKCFDLKRNKDCQEMAIQSATADISRDARRSIYEMPRLLDVTDGGRELFEACRTGDVNKVTSLVGSRWSVNMRDTAGRKSTPLHFAAGKTHFLAVFNLKLPIYLLVNILVLCFAINNAYKQQQTNKGAKKTF